MDPNDICFLVCMPKDSPLHSFRSSELLLVNRIQQKSWHMTFKFRLQETIALVLSTLSGCSHLPSDKASHHIMSCPIEREQPYHSKAMREAPDQQPMRNWGPQPNNLQGTNAANNRMSGFTSRSFPSEPLKWLQPQSNPWLWSCERPSARGPS